MARFLEESQIAEYRDCFNLYDNKRNGKLACTDLMSVMRSLGTCPTPKEVNKHLESIGKKPQPSQYMDFSQLLTVMHKQKENEANINDDILRAFAMTEESKKGEIPVRVLKRILMTTGEKLTVREVDQMLRAANMQNKHTIKYSDFVAMVSMPIPDY